jgi:sugar phosphate isomerase/epimerase
VTDVPRIAAFPKGFFQQLLDRTEWVLVDWIRAAASLGLDGVELYPAFLDGQDVPYLARLRNLAEAVGLSLPMMCASPDFIDPRPGAWERAIAALSEESPTPFHLTVAWGGDMILEFADSSLSVRP